MTERVPVAVIVPNYNSGVDLERCVASINQKTWPQEIVIVDDASTDGSLAVAASLATQFDNVTVLAQPRNAGAAEARRIGIGSVSCDWIAFVDADDWIEPDAVGSAYEQAVVQDLDICIWHLIKEDGYRRWPVMDLNPVDFPMSGREAVRRTLGQWRVHPLGVARRDLYLNAYNGFIHSSYNADELITRLVFLETGRVGLSSKEYYYTLNGESTTLKMKPKLIGGIDSGLWLVDFAMVHEFGPRVVAGVVQSAVLTCWVMFRNRKRLGEAEVQRAVARACSYMYMKVNMSVWNKVGKKHIVKFLFLCTWSSIKT